MTTAQVVCVALAVGAVLAGCCAAPVRGADWDDVQQLKLKYVRMAAEHAIQQQKTDEARSVPIAFPSGLTAHGKLDVVERSPASLTIEATAAPKAYRTEATEFIRIRVAKRMDMVSNHSGLAFTVETAAGTSPEVRVGCRLLTASGEAATILPIVPILSPWGDARHEIYLDWAFLNYDDVEQAVAVLKQVDTIEITLASAQRAPQRGSSAEAQPARFTMSNLRLVDYLKGSYDPSRRWLKFNDEAGRWEPGGEKDLTLQHRCQEVTGLVASFGGAAGARSAVDSLDFAVRTQCWDGSFLDGRRGANTVASGEYTFGFTLYGLLCGYMALDKQGAAALDEKITIGPETMTRREFCQRMFYRGAMARTAAGNIADYRDDIIGGNTLITGANRVLGYAIAMRMIAEALPDKAQKEKVLAGYRPIMGEIADAQGKFSGGFPLLGEGDRYKGKGIHYDGGYTRTHMDWLVVGVQRTGDPLLVQMLRRYQDVFEAVMNSEGTGLKKLISERHPEGGDVELVLPDATAQVGMKHKLPIIAQWGYNCGIPVWTHWEQKPGNHFTFASHARGYSLGAHVSILVDDMQAEPEPKDLGYLFPRQMPVWSSRLYTKDGSLVRTSRIRIESDGRTSDDFKIEVGEYPATVGVPVRVRSPKGAVLVTADKLSGWPKLLPDGAAVTVSGDLSGEGRVGTPMKFTLTGKARVVITGPDVTLPPEAGGEKVPFRAELTLEPEGNNLPVELTVVNSVAP
ncbi:MAG: hypothetical protein JXL80_14160 [Planctomycetes bacterium]|nr:hypothetical protein [Planctomycetota bacterium]